MPKQKGIKGTPLGSFRTQKAAKDRIRKLKKDKRTKGVNFGLSRSPGGAFTIRKRRK